MLDSDSLSQLASLKSQIGEDKPRYTGQVRGTANRFGFVVTEEDESHFLPPDEMKRVLPGDRIEFSLTQNGDRTQAEVEQLIESDLKQFVGRVVVKGKNKLVAADHPGLNRWLALTHSSARDLLEGQWIRCTLTRHPIDDGRAMAEVNAILGDDDTPFIEHEVAKARFGLASAFPEPVLKAAETLDYAARLAAQDDYEDASHLPLITIDSASTQDMDDAFCIEDDGDAWRLSVAIADPSLYVDPGSPLDLEALKRNTSRYLPSETLHMLPAELAETRCSLKPGVIRPALLMQARVDKQTGVPQAPRFAFARIQSRAKLSYTEVADLLSGASDNTTLSAGLETPGTQDQLRALSELAGQLNQYRQTHCVVMADKPDFRLRLNERGHIRLIEEENRNTANQMVEEIMLLTNRLTAEHLAAHDAGLFLCHDGFRDEQLETVEALIRSALDDVPSDLSDFKQMLPVLQQAQAHASLPLDKMLSKFYRRTALSDQPRPHWGLGFPAYTTVTSPIRKYLDLHMHRQLKAIWRGQTVPRLPETEWAQLLDTQGTGRAVANFTEQWLKAIFLKDWEGDVLEGVIQHVTPNGFSVQLAGLGTTGFVNVKGWRDRTAHFDPVHMIHKTERGEFTLDQPVKVKVQSVDLERRNIQLELAS